jgi:general secretion pathway protein E/type IV pilus assembly protein PilB
MITATVEAILAQRLVRRLCVHCREPLNLKKDDVPDDFPWEKLGDQTIYKPVGCRHCRDVGYSGRLGIYELLVTTDELRELALNRASTWDIKKAAVASGMLTLRDDGWDKVLAGATSIDEVVRITKGDRVS